MYRRPVKVTMSLLISSILILLTVTITTSVASLPSPANGQMNNIIDALIGAGDFNSWANMLSMADNIPFPLSATFFIPSDSEQPPPVDQMMSIMAYHTVPQRLAFSQLCLMKPFSHLPTLVPTKSITIFNSSISNFTLDHTFVSHPDLYLTSSFAVHGIQSFLDFPHSNFTTTTTTNPFAPPLPESPPPPTRSDAAVDSFLFLDLSLVFLVFSSLCLL